MSGSGEGGDMTTVQNGIPALVSTKPLDTFTESLGLFPAMSVVKEPGKPQHDLDPNSN